MRVRPVLAVRVRAASFMLDDVRRLSQGTVGTDREDRNAPVPVIRDDHMRPGWVNRQMARRSSVRTHLPDFGQGAIVRIYRERRDRPVRRPLETVTLTDGIEEPSILMPRNKRWTIDWCRLHVVKRAGRAVKSPDANPLPIFLVPIAARIDRPIHE